MIQLPKLYCNNAFFQKNVVTNEVVMAKMCYGTEVKIRLPNWHVMTLEFIIFSYELAI
jgi:hypothetical protein